MSRHGSDCEAHPSRRHKHSHWRCSTPKCVVAAMHTHSRVILRRRHNAAPAWRWRTRGLRPHLRGPGCRLQASRTLDLTLDLACATWCGVQNLWYVVQAGARCSRFDIRSMTLTSGGTRGSGLPTPCSTDYAVRRVRALTELLLQRGVELELLAWVQCGEDVVAGKGCQRFGVCRETLCLSHTEQERRSIVSQEWQLQRQHHTSTPRQV